ncbi:hypothetical protein KC851_04700 [Candidatus Kaiserbacteria bacterium]|nr:hypothetical protein [Candidatus Kaiserbacteria bacterium]
MSNLDNAKLDTSRESLERFRTQIGYNISSLGVITKCNAVIIVVSYQENLSAEFAKGRLIKTWDELSVGGISDFTRDIKIFTDIGSLKFLAECSLGIHSVTIGDSQVASQVREGLQNGLREENDVLGIIANWISFIVEESKLKTDIFLGNTSLERIACDILVKRISKNKQVLIVGYGKSGKLVSKILNKENEIPIKISNRTPVSIKDEGFNEESVTFLDLDKINTTSDTGAVVIALNNTPETKKIIYELDYLAKLENEDTLIIDLSSPPFLSEQKNVINLKGLSKIASENEKLRKNEVSKVRDIVNNNVASLVKSLNNRIGELYLQEQKNQKLILGNSKLEIVKQRHELLFHIRKQLTTKDFIEVSTPYIVGISTDPPKVDDGGTIDVDWSKGSTAFLRQSNQIYKQVLVASGLNKIYEIGPFWRKETYDSYRHLQESVGLDIEIKNPKNLEELYKLSCEIICESASKLSKEFSLENKLELPQVDSIPVITYFEAINLLHSNGNYIKLGEDLGLVNESELGKIIKTNFKSDIFVIIDYPDTIKKFYTKEKAGGLTETFDVILGGWEIVSGAIRQTDGNKIRKSMLLSGINTKNYEFYLSVVDKADPHGGFCIGIDRLLAKILGLDMVHDAVPFPRTFNKLIP